MDGKGTIVYIGGFELPDKNAAAHRVINNAKIFRDLGYKVVFIGVDETLARGSKITETKTSNQGFDSWSIPYPSNISEWYKYLTDIKDFKSVFELYDNACLVIAYNYQAIALHKIKKYCRKHNCKIIADCTEWYNNQGSKLVFKVVKGFDSFLRMRLIQKKLDGLIVISSYLEKYYNNIIPTLRIPPLVDITEDKWSDVSIEQEHQRVKFVFSGTLGRNKEKVDRIINAFSKVKNKELYKLEIIGINEQEYVIRYPDDLEVLNKLRGNIMFHGKKSHLQSLKILKSADFCIFIRENNFSNKAGFPTKFVESITSGIPVITTLTSDLNEYLSSEKNGFQINITNEENTIRILDRVINLERNEIAKMKNHCKKTNRFHYKLYNNSVHDFLKRLDLKSKD